MAELLDGIDNFSGGMDSSRGADYIEDTQCAKLVNCAISSVGDDIGPRWGFHHQQIQFEEDRARDFYNDCKHVQGEGWYDDETGRVLLASVDGWIYEFRSPRRDFWTAKIINRSDQNNPNRTKAWFARVPGGAVMNDGESNTFFINKNGAERMDIGVGRMVTYVQNRLFWVSQDGRSIIAGDINNIFSVNEIADTGIAGFIVPEDIDQLTAIGRQKHLLRDINGGELIFSTDNNVYSADVIGDRRDWPNRGAKLLVAGSGATSGYSFENYNSNIWFRTFDDGLMNFKQSAAQFVQDSDTTGTSVEVDLWLDRDTPWMLDQCYSRRFNRRLFTTTAPQINESGFAYWNGIISMSPDPIFAGRNKLPRRFEGLWTGVRPWCMTEVHGNGRESAMYIHSFDSDGKTRLYRMDPQSDFDITPNGDRKEIEWSGDTRSFVYGERMAPKTPSYRFYALKDLKRDTRVRFSSRTESQGQWKEFWDYTHRASVNYKRTISGREPRKQHRPCVPMSNEQENNNTPGNFGGTGFFHRAYRWEITGPAKLSRVITGSDSQSKEFVAENEEEDSVELEYEVTDDFEYQIA